MKVLVACEFSGIVRDAFIKCGHDAWSCDLLETERPGPHYKRFVEDVLLQGVKWDLMIAHPPCTYLTNAGVRWLYSGDKPKDNQKRRPDQKRWTLMQTAAEFFDKMLSADIPHICVENPIMHKYAMRHIQEPYTQIIQPWMFGHAETKATCLWLKNLPLLRPTNIIEPDFTKYPKRVQISLSTGNVKQGRGKGYATRIIGGSGGYDPRVHYASPGPDRWKERSRTLIGIAEAMAEQWGRPDQAKLESEKAMELMRRK